VADLNYSVADFVPGEYFVIAQVETADEGATTDGDFPNELYPVLSTPKGQLRLFFPLKYVWDTPTIKHPLAIWFYLNKRSSPTASMVVAKAGPVQYKPQ